MGRRDPVSVTGGSAGVTANCADIVAMARRFAAAAEDTLAAAMSLHRYLADLGVLTSALLDPVGFAEFEADLLAALDGWQGLSWAGGECGLIAGELRAAATAYRAADRLSTELHDVVIGALDLAPAVAAGAAVLARTGDPLRAAQAAIARDPQAADLVIDALGLPDVVRALSAALPDGHGVLRHPGIDARGAAGRPPRRLTDVLADLAVRAASRHGEIDVRILTMPDGSRRAIVDISGTKSWTPLPTRDVTSLTTNGRALVGERTAYEQGVLAAMRAAGVRPTDDVMLVGHSQGGMVAVTSARDAVRSHRFNVTHVVTTGSPIGMTVGSVPASVKVLAVENSRDVVPHLDGRANPDKANVTTASEARGNRTILGDHGLRQSYLQIAADVQASDNASVRDFLRSADGYFHATTVETHTYQVQRRY